LTQRQLIAEAEAIAKEIKSNSRKSAKMWEFPVNLKNYD
jgi:hypothetical protein